MALELAFAGAALAAMVALPSAAQDAEAGGEIFEQWCTVCHGPEGRGDGPGAGVLDLPDLTQIAAENGGVFPVDRVAAQIDGRVASEAHGGLMPVFGEFLEGPQVAVPTAAGQPVMMAQAVADLVVWLEGVQE